MPQSSKDKLLLSTYFLNTTLANNVFTTGQGFRDFFCQIGSVEMKSFRHAQFLTSPAN